MSKKKIEYIRRDKAINYAQWEGAYKVVMYLEDMKAEDVQPVRHGKWIEIDDVSVRGKCSACQWEAHLYEDDVFGMPYCPNCGAEMIKG